MTTIIVPLCKYFNKKINGVWNLVRFGKARNLSFTDKDELPGSLIAFDARKRKLLFFRQSGYRQSCMILDLAFMDSCSVIKQYDSIDAGGLKKKKLHSYLKGIFLAFRFNNNSRMVAIPFYEAGQGAVGDMKKLDRKANKWKMILSKKPLRGWPESIS